MFLIEDQAKAILYTGDIRGMGSYPFGFVLYMYTSC